MRVRLTQIDGALPNIALMRLASWHRSRGDEVVFTRSVTREPGEGEYDRVYGSSIFDFSQVNQMRFMAAFPGAILGGTGTPFSHTVEEAVGVAENTPLDYECYPDVDYSIGFTQRGCRLKCGFCVVPRKEGKNRSVATISDIYRGDDSPRKIHLLDNDFFGQALDEWRARIKELRDGRFKVCFSQGINVRLIDQEGAEELATLRYYDTKFEKRRIYMAWDNLKDEKVFFRGVDMLERAGIPPHRIMAYMLIGYDKNETWDRIWYRYYRMIERGIMPYPMVYKRSRKDLKAFQRWAIQPLLRGVEWKDYHQKTKSTESVFAHEVMTQVMSRDRFTKILLADEL